MSHSYEDITRTSRKFTLKPDWVQPPEGDFRFNRDMLRFPGTISEMYNLGSAISRSIKYKFTNLSKADELYILEFFRDCQGRLVRFWLPVWENAMRLYTSIATFDEYLYVYNVRFYSQYYEHERIFIETTTGDVITRHVVGSTGDPADPYEVLQVETPMDRNLTQDDIAFFGRYLLVRFDIDELEVRMITDEVSELVIPFVEVVHEYVPEEIES